MSFANLMRNLGFVTLGAVLVSAAAFFLATRDSSNSSSSQTVEIVEESQPATAPEQSSTRADDQSVDDVASPLQPGSEIIRKPSRATSTGLVPAAIEPFQADPFEDFSGATPPPPPPGSQLAAKPPVRPAKPIKFDPRETSWEDPFDAEFWEATGWKFDQQGMNSEADAKAVFRRTYRRLMLEAKIELLKEGDAPLQLRLLAPSNDALVEINLKGADLVLHDKSRNAGALLGTATLNPAPAPGRPGLLRVAATGNRLVLSWNGQIVLSCDQPATQSGRDLQIEWKAGGTPYRISHLRLEGE